VLRHLPAVDDARVLVAALTRDDAAVYRLSADRALVATLDFFTPIVDDAYTFGAIAAANALSDLYAMGATPIFALNIVAWPRDPDVLPLVGDAMRGGAEKIREAGAFILGGHSIEDREPKLGMVAIGEVHPERLLTNAGARPGDRLLLTKPLGTGILATALKQGTIGEQDMPEAIQSMLTLNAGALAAVRAVGAGVHAMTDVTGFGLLGHLHTMLTASAVGARLEAGRVPWFPRVRELIEAGAVPGGTARNAAAAAGFSAWADGVDDATRTLLCDAQTSGGLLISVDPAVAPRLLAALEDAQTPVAADIGGVTVAGTPMLEIVHERS
jgi:selenide,water dikinase